MKAKISEIFKSIQGEGKYAGIRQVFVRFYGCNMRCVWCDTPYAIGDKPGRFKECSLEDVIQRINGLKDGCHSVSLTGGEPLVQKDFIKALIPFIKKLKLKTYLETNGILPEELKKVVNGIDIIAMDIKLPSSTKERSYWQEHKDFLKIALKKELFIKTVVSSDTKKEDMMEATHLVSKINRDILFILQPNFFEMKNGVMDRCLEFETYCSRYLRNVRIIPQMHKFMRLR